MFGKTHIHQSGSALCHASGGLIIQFDDAAGMPPEICCEDCRRRFKNITGIDIKKRIIDKAVLRGKTNTINI